MRFSGFLIGIYEALELRDGGSDYLGKGVSKVSCFFNVQTFLSTFVVLYLKTYLSSAYVGC